MSYQKYLGEGVIIKMGEFGESGRILKILTREGVKSLVATGVRELKSKMRSEIDVLTKVEFEFVEGKEVGRLVGIFPKEKLMNLKSDYVLENIVLIRNAISNVTNFILRTVVGETENNGLYESFLEGLGVLQEQATSAKNPFRVGLSPEHTSLGKVSRPKVEAEGVLQGKNYFTTIEIIWLIKILVSLGYWEENLHDKFDDENMKYVLENKKQIIEQINKSIESSHM